MPNWVAHRIELQGDEADFELVLGVCRGRGDDWAEGYDACEYLPHGRIRVTHRSRYSPQYDLAYDISLALPQARVHLDFYEPMLVIDGSFAFQAGHVVQFWERYDESVTEWSAESGTLRECRLEYLEAGDPFGDYTQHLIGEWERTEDQIFSTGQRADVLNVDIGVGGEWVPLLLPTLEDLELGLGLLDHPVVPSDVALGVMIQEFGRLAGQLGWEPCAELGGCFPVPLGAGGPGANAPLGAILELGVEDEWVFRTTANGVGATYSTVRDVATALGVTETTLLRRVRRALIGELEEYGAAFGFRGRGSAHAGVLTAGDV